MVRFVDLFAGIGGIRKGLELSLERHGVASQCVFSSEIDPHAQETYRQNYGEVPAGDIREVTSLPEHDILLAGFPCQAFSYAGKQRGFADTRGTLFFEIERLLRSAAKKPKILLLENVRGFLSHDKGRTWETVRSVLNELGYGVMVHVLNSSNFGLPQNRVRIYIVATLATTPQTRIVSDFGAADSHSFKNKIAHLGLHRGKYPLKTVFDILEEHPSSKYDCSERFIGQLSMALGNRSFDALHGVRLIDYRGGNSIHSWDLGTKGECTLHERRLMNAIISNRRKKVFGVHQDGKRLSKKQIATFWSEDNLDRLLESLTQKGYLKPVDGAYNPVCGNMSFEVFKFLDPNSISITVVSSDAHRLGVVQNGRPRRITPRECARMQGFPDDFLLHRSDAKAYHQLGNSVSVPVVQAVIDDLWDMGYMNTHCLRLECA